MAWTQSDIDALKAAMGTGVRDVTYSDGSRQVYRDLGEMRQVLSMMQAEVGAAGGASPRVKVTRLFGARGL